MSCTGYRSVLSCAGYLSESLLIWKTPTNKDHGWSDCGSSRVQKAHGSRRLWYAGLLPLVSQGSICSLLRGTTFSSMAFALSKKVDRP